MEVCPRNDLCICFIITGRRASCKSIVENMCRDCCSFNSFQKERISPLFMSAIKSSRYGWKGPGPYGAPDGTGRLTVGAAVLDLAKVLDDAVSCDSDDFTLARSIIAAT